MQKKVMQKQLQVTRGANPHGAGDYKKRGRFWAVTDDAGRLVCLAVYKKGAQEVLRRMTAATATNARPKRRSRPGRRQRQD